MNSGRPEKRNQFFVNKWIKISPLLCKKVCLELISLAVPQNKTTFTCYGYRAFKNETKSNYSNGFQQIEKLLSVSEQSEYMNVV